MKQARKESDRPFEGNFVSRTMGKIEIGRRVGIDEIGLSVGKEK